MTKRAVVVGINDYSVQGVKSLRWCVNDAQAMREVLTAAFDVPKDNIHMYLDKNATHSAIRSALRYCVAQSEPGDVICFYFSGHGARLPHPTKADTFYETIVPAAGTYITDHELFQIADGLAPSHVNFTIILDSCHSGGIADLAEGKCLVYSDTLKRQMERMKTLVPFIGSNPVNLGDLIHNIVSTAIDAQGQVTCEEDPAKIFIPEAKMTLLAGCLPKELSREHSSLKHGLLTQAMLDIINTCPFVATYDEFIGDVKAHVSANMTKLFPGKSQTPVLRGKKERMSENIFDGFTNSIP